MFLFVVACSGMSPQEANMVFERANRVGFDAYTTTYADSETATARDSGTFTWTSEEDGFALRAASSAPRSGRARSISPAPEREKVRWLSSSTRTANTRKTPPRRIAN